jgi:seryl-tRNA synthetase
VPERGPRTPAAGRARRTPVPGEIEAALERRLVRMASQHGAVDADPPYLLSREFLDRTQFFASFPRRAVPSGRGGSFMPPATCYRLFQALQGTLLEGPLVVTLTGPCFRREPRYDAGRRYAFTMREVVFVAHEERVAAARDFAADASLRLARELGLDARLEDAEDTFFAETGRAKRALQRLLRLKVELVASAAGGSLAVASFNLHQDFFGTRLGIRLGGPNAAWSGCAAWGIERWRLALEERWGSAPGRWPPEVREELALHG